MKKLINIFTVCLAASVAALCISCSNPSSSGGSNPGNGLSSEDNRYYYEAGNKLHFTNEGFAKQLKQGTVFFYIGKNAATTSDIIDIVIVKNPNNIKVTTECVWVENDTENLISTMMNNPNWVTHDYWANLNKTPNGYVKFSADKEGTITYYLTNKNKKWYVPTEPELSESFCKTITIEAAGF